MLQKNIQALFHPERYHGWGKTRKYFEGWYYKIVSADEKHAFAIIPGIAMDNNGQKHAFIQILDGINQTAEYLKFPADEFVSQADTFQTEISGNTFSGTQLRLNLKNAKGELQFKNTVPWPNQWYSPGIMGPYTFVPFMECYHGILSMDHAIQGSLEINNTTIDFTGGRGYVEKDWGHSFPSAYIWMQSNHFSETGISLNASVAKIPWLGSSFVGFIAGIYLNRQLIQFTTYNSTKLIRSLATKETVELFMENKKYRLEIVVTRNHATELASPIAGFMDGRISESMTSNLEVKLTNRKTGETVFADTGRCAALEVAGAIDEITLNREA
ncbi:MAG TPA: tocopherol cyclase family protein [Prolixibacteraceae bacterium]|nr:tocopherol cyclase family protein [Prolixibacteraceae bacterium]